MKRVLAITVGGSSEPIARSIVDRQPELVIFFVTTEPKGGSQRQVLEKVDGQESIISRTGLTEDRFELIALDDPDDIVACYEAMKKSMEQAVEKVPDGEYIADYTGGTKTMSAALVLSAMRLDWKLSLVRGERVNLVKALNGTEIAQFVHTGPLHLEQALSKAAMLFDLFNYEAVEALLQASLNENPVNGANADRIRHTISLARAFGAWDRFEHETAFELLRVFYDQLSDYVKKLGALLGKGHTPLYEKVWDLLRNAERRAAQGRYDDAALRLYRALELFAQIRLQQEYGQDTSNLDLDKLPPPAQRMLSWQKAQGRKRVTAGLFDSYRLLAILGDPVGMLYEEKWADPIKEVLERRNRSILAHGTDPVGKEVWERVHEITNGFLSEAAAEIRIRSDWPQFPKWDEVKETL